jgi:hypothetical protein
LAAAGILCFAVRVTVAAGWSDNFNDGNIADGTPITWRTNLLGAFPGTYDVSSGDLRLSAPGDANGNGSANNDQLVAWVDTVPLGNSYIRLQGQIVPGAMPEETGGNLAILGRLDTSTVSAYVLYIDDGGQMGLQISLGGNLADLVPSVDLPELAAATDVIIELDMVGSELSGFAWRPGESKPEFPQITATDTTFTTGPAGIAYDEDDDNTTGVFRFVAAQDTPFAAGLTGDYNGNGVVDAADYALWRNGDALQNDPTPGTQAEDYTTWKANFGAGAAPGSAADQAASVPEPAGVLLILLAAIGAAGIVGRTDRR